MMRRKLGWALAGFVSLSAVAATLTHPDMAASGVRIVVAGARYMTGSMSSGTSSAAAVDTTLTAANGVALSFPSEGSGQFSVRLTGQGMATAVGKDPVRVFVCDVSECPKDGSGQPTVDKAPVGGNSTLYTSVARNGNVVLASATITTGQNTSFLVEDTYSVAGSASPGAFKMVRRVTASLPTGTDTDRGFSSQFRMSFETPASKPYHYFSPAVWYDQNSYAPATWFGGSGTQGKSSVYWRETRAGLPLVMMQDPGTGTALTVAHIGDAPSSNIVERPGLSTDETPGDNDRWLVSSDIRYGSLGVQRASSAAPSIGFIYPANETMQDNKDTVSWIHRSNLITDKYYQQYTMLLSLDVQGSSLANGDVATRDINAAMADSWRMVYDIMRPTPYRDGGSGVPAVIDPEDVFSAGIGLIFDYSKTGTNSAGIAGAATLPAGWTTSEIQSKSDWQYVMGYIGEQIPLAFQMYWRSFDKNERYHNPADLQRKAKAILDFWATRSASLQGDVRTNPTLPRTWYMEGSDTFANTKCTIPIYLRYLGDGMEAMVSAAVLARQQGEPQVAWEKATLNFGYWLVNNQQPGGYWYRAYAPDGTQYAPDSTCTNGPGTNATAGDLRQNTTHVIRFLAQLAKATDNQADKDKFLKAATAAGNFAIQQTFGVGKYTGGTTDTPNVTDREGAIIAMRAALALYDATGKTDWLKWARQAAIVAESYTYAYSFKLNTAAGSPVPAQQQWGSLGMSMISTGQSGADNSASLLSYDLFRLYLADPSNDAHFLDAAQLMESTTKYTTQIPAAGQNYGFGHEGLAPEATALFLLQPTQRIADKKGNYPPAWQWLPWVTNAELDPLQRMQDKFGNKSIAKSLALGLANLQEKNRAGLPGPWPNWGG